MTLSARDLLTPNVLRVPAEARPTDYHREMVGSQPLVFAVFEHETFVGLVDAQAIVHHPQRIFLDLCHFNPESIVDTTPLDQILVEMERQQKSVLPVSNADGQFLGVVTRRSIANVLLSQVQEQRLREHEITVRTLGQLSEETERRRQEAEVLAALAHSLNASLELDTILPRVAEGARDLCRGDTASIALREPGENAAVIRYHVGRGAELFKGRCIDPGNGLGGEVLRTGRPTRTEQYATDARPSPDLKRIVCAGGMVTALVVPIMIDQRVEGLLYVARCSPPPFTDHNQEILQRLADYAAVAIHNARLYAEAQRRRWVAESLAEVNYLLLQALDPAEVGQWIVESIRGLLQAQAVALYRLNPEADTLVALATAGAISLQTFPHGTGLSWLAVQQRASVVTPNILADPRVMLTLAQRAGLRRLACPAVLVAPLRIGARVIGTLTIADHLGRVYDPEAIEMAQAFADQGATALHNAQLYAELQDGRARQQALSRQLLEVQESERRRLASELHDELGQTLTALKLQLAAGQRLAGLQIRQDCFDTSLDLVEQAQQQVRTLALELRPSLLDDLGLLPALRWCVDQQAQRGGFQARISVAPPDLRVPPHLETSCFRIAQEALTNVVRHAQAREVWVEVSQHETELLLYIQDDGVGFEVAAAQARARQGGSLGVLGMQERAELVGGHLEIVSSPGDGTSIRARFPLSDTAVVAPAHAAVPSPRQQWRQARTRRTTPGALGPVPRTGDRSTL